MGIVWIKALTLRTGHANVIGHVDRVLAMMAGGVLDPTPLVTHHMALADAAGGLRRLRPPRGAQDRDDAVNDVERGTAALLMRRREIARPGRRAVGWKIGFNCRRSSRSSASTRPLAGFLSSDGLLEDGAEWSLGDGGAVVVESEVAVELGDDGRSIVALLPALELADPPDLEQDVETILAGNIFHRAVAFGPRVETARARRGAHPRERRGAARDRAPSRRAPASRRWSSVVAGRLAGAGEQLRPGERIITGVLAPPHAGREPGRHGAARSSSAPRRRGAALQAALAFSAQMTTAATLPDALSEPARAFAAGPHRLLIGGERLEAADGRTFETLDPSTGRAIAEVAQAGAEDVDRAVRAAREAFEDGRWSGVSAAERTRAMLALRRRDRGARRRAGRARVARQRQAGQAGQARGRARSRPSTCATSRAGRPRSPATMLPVAQREHALLHAQGAGGRLRPDHPLELPAADGGLEDRPGAGGGLHVVLKPAEQTPLTALRLGELALEAGLPEGVLNVITGDGETGAALVDHQDVDKIAFTGSTVVGREIGAKAGRALKRVTLELGGKSPNIILPDADLDVAVKGAYQAIYYNTGQACNAGSRLFVHSDQYDEVVAGLVEAAGEGPHRARPRARHPARAADLRRAGGARARLHRVGQAPRAPSS